MIKNYLTETDLQGYLYEKDALRWTGQSDLSLSKAQAEQTVVLDMINRGYRAEISRPDLYLRTDTTTLTTALTGDSIEDTANRLRLAYNVTVRTGTTAIVLQGSNDESTWTTIQTQSITATGEGSFTFISAFKYYRINATVSGTLAFTAWLTEIVWDQFFKFKWLEVMLMNAGKGEDNKYTQYAIYFRNEYNDLFDKAKILIEENEEVVEKKTNIIDRHN